jgi:hypothetical protein
MSFQIWTELDDQLMNKDLTFLVQRMMFDLKKKQKRYKEF